PRKAVTGSLIDLVFTTTLIAVLSAVAAPPLAAALGDYRAAGAARYFAGFLQRARMEAVLRSTEVAVRFTPTVGSGYTFGLFVDGNGNGVLSRDILRGIDAQVGPAHGLSDNFTGVEFGTLPGLPPIDAGGAPPGNDSIHLGAANSVSFSPVGTSS